MSPVLLAALLLGPPPHLQAPPETPPEPPPVSGPEAEPPRGLRLREAGAFDGYTLFSPLSSRTAYLIDLDGEVVHAWETEHAPTGAVYLLPNGHLLRTARTESSPRFHGGGIGGLVQEFDWEGGLVWEYELAGDYQTQHHDVDPLPDGNVLVIAWEHRYAEDAIAWGRDPAAIGEDGLWPDCVLEIRPTPPSGGELVWEWHVWDHVIQDVDPGAENHGEVAEHPELVDLNADHRDRPPLTSEERERQAEVERQMRALGYTGGEDEDEPPPPPRDRGRDADWLHTNAIDYLPEHDLIVLSTPHLSELWVIDHSTTTEQAAFHSGGRFGKGGDLLWRWGNPRNYGAGTDADRRLFYQHDAQWLPSAQPGELRLLVFNNGGGRPGGDHSSVDELVLEFDPATGFPREPGRPYGPAQPAWTYADPGRFFSGFISGAQRLPNGNTLICEGVNGRVFEVTPAGAIVWEYWNPFGGEVAPQQHAGNAPPMALFRAVRIAKDHPGLPTELRAAR